MKETIFGVLGLSAAVIAGLMTWAMVVSWHWRIEFLAAVEPTLRRRVSSLFATLWLLPAMFYLGAVRNLALAGHVHPWAINGLLSLVMVMTAFHLTRAVVLLQRITRRERVG